MFLIQIYFASWIRSGTGKYRTGSVIKIYGSGSSLFNQRFKEIRKKLNVEIFT